MKNVGIPVGIPEIDQYINVRKGMLITVAAPTGIGKSSLAVSVFVLSLFRNWLMNQGNVDYPNIQWHMFSMERSALLMRTKMLSWLMTANYGVNYSIDQLLSWQQDNPINPEIIPYIPQMLRYLDFLNDKITISAGEKRTEEVTGIITDIMNREGCNVYSRMERDDYTGRISGDIYVNYDIVANFDSDTYEENEFGTRRYYKDITVYNEVVRVFENDAFYIPEDKTKIHLFIIDHISKTILGTDGNGRTLNRKQTNDEMSNALAMLRDYYQCSFIVVSQMNRSIYDIDPQKTLNGVVPDETHIADSSTLSHNSDIILGMLNPAKMGDWQHSSYNIQEFVTEEGYCTFRSLFVIKNTFGQDGVMIPFNFIGSSGYFRPLPPVMQVTESVAYMARRGLFEYQGMSYEQHCGWM